jgi:hypothetical protein
MPGIWDLIAKKQIIPSIKAEDYLPEGWDIPSRAINTAQKWLIPHSPLEIALMAMPLKRMGKYVKEATKLAPKVRPANAGLWDEITSIKDELKQVPLTFGVPGTAINSHSIGLANANLKSTPIKELPKEMWETIRSLYNPEYAASLNDKLVGPLSPQRAEEYFKDVIIKANPHLAQNPQGLRAAVDHALNAYEQTLPAGNRFADVRKLEKAGLRTADTTAGKTGAGTTPDVEILSKPIQVGGVNVNPFSIQRHLFDEPTFGERKVNELWKRRSALRELDRASAVGISDPEKQAVDFATNMFGGYGAKDPVLNSQAADTIMKWAFVAPDWMRRHFRLAGAKIKSITPSNPITPKISRGHWTGELNNPEFFPYRRALGYDAAQGLGAVGATKALTGEWGSDKATNVTNVQLPGDYAGKVAVGRPAGTEMDAWRTLFDMGNAATGLYNDDPRNVAAFVEPFKNRIHPVTKFVGDVAFNSNWRGQALYDKEKFAKYTTTRSGKTFTERENIPGREAAKRIGKDFLANMMPSAYDAFTTDMYNTDGQSNLEFKSKMGELPFSFYRRPFTQRRDSRFNRRSSR